MLWSIIIITPLLIVNSQATLHFMIFLGKNATLPISNSEFILCAKTPEYDWKKHTTMLISLTLLLMEIYC